MYTSGRIDVVKVRVDTTKALGAYQLFVIERLVGLPKLYMSFGGDISQLIIICHKK